MSTCASLALISANFLAESLFLFDGQLGFTDYSFCTLRKQPKSVAYLRVQDLFLPA